MIATFQKHVLQFKNPSGTSRGILKTKDTYFLEIIQHNNKGIGECALFRGLSADDVPEYEEKLNWLCANINENPEVLKHELRKFPSIWFGLEQAFDNLNFDENIYFPSDFTGGKSSISINGLIWMGETAFMKKQITEKLDAGFNCIKLKIGVNWPSEKEILKNLRKQFSASQLEIRVDANGGFGFKEAKTVLQELAEMKIHSIEQPIKAGNIQEMALLCAETPTPIALDEELIGVFDIQNKKPLLETIKPQYIILKPALVGGFSGTDEWISEAEKCKVGWWITSALESNIGLNALAQYTFLKGNKMPQGLGTGSLFTNNKGPVLRLAGDQLWFK